MICGIAVASDQWRVYGYYIRQINTYLTTTIILDVNPGNPRNRNNINHENPKNPNAARRYYRERLGFRAE
jgi:hypothetical protein